MDHQLPRLPRRSSIGRKTVITVLGVGVTLIGLMLLVLPGPGLLVLVAGLAILATEYAWARRLQHRVWDRLRRRRASQDDR